jgi:hypothetical protein
MTFPVLVEPYNGQYAAVLVGAPTIRAVGATRDEALAALQTDLTQRRIRGELVSLDLPTTGVSGLAGKYRPDPTLREICTEAYCLRNAESEA